jgi:hypothetical protein
MPERPCRPTTKERQFDPRSRAAGGHTTRQKRITSVETAPARTLQHTGRGDRGGAALASGPANAAAAARTTGTTRDSRRGTGNGGKGVCRRRNKQETRPLAAKAPDETARQAVRGARHRTPGPPPPGLPGATDGNHGESTGTYSNRTLGGTDFRVEPPEHTSCSLLRSRRRSDPNPAPVGDTDWLWFRVVGQKRDSRQVRRKRLGSNSASSPLQLSVPSGNPCRQESH